MYICLVSLLQVYPTWYISLQDERNVTNYYNHYRIPANVYVCFKEILADFNLAVAQADRQTAEFSSYTVAQVTFSNELKWYNPNPNPCMYLQQVDTNQEDFIVK